jgi:hypothetical protein
MTKSHFDSQNISNKFYHALCKVFDKQSIPNGLNSVTTNAPVNNIFMCSLNKQHYLFVDNNKLGVINLQFMNNDFEVIIRHNSVYNIMSGQTFFVFQTDGNFVAYDKCSNKPLWATNTQSKGYNKLSIDNTGNITFSNMQNPKAPTQSMFMYQMLEIPQGMPTMNMAFNSPNSGNINLEYICNSIKENILYHHKSKHMTHKISPKPTKITDCGYDGQLKGWYDIQGQGERNDFCRYVGSPEWFSCELAGTNKPYTPLTDYYEQNQPHDPFNGGYGCAS